MHLHLPCPSNVKNQHQRLIASDSNGFLSALPLLIRLGIAKRKAAHALIGAGLATDAAGARGEQDTPEADGGETGVDRGAGRERHRADGGPSRVTVERDGRVEGGRDGESRKGVRGLGIFRVRRCRRRRCFAGRISCLEP